MTFPGEHIIAGFTLGFRYREQLASVMRTVSLDSTVLSIDPPAFREMGIEVLALDFDGVLAPHGFGEPLPEVIDWLRRCVEAFGVERIFILSNKPTDERVRWFNANFPGLCFIGGVRKKPFPDGLERISDLARVPATSILMVDDRLLTGCLGAIHAGAHPCYIRRPFVSWRHRPFAELFFMLLRKGERLVVGCITF